MIKLVYNQLIHRFKTSKLLILVYLMAIFFGLMMIVSQTDMSYIVDRKIILEYMSMSNVVTVFVLIQPVIYFMMIYKMFQDYKKGSIRWGLLTKNKAAFVIGDVIFLLLSIFLLYGIGYCLLYYGVYEQMKCLDQKVLGTYGLLNASYFLAHSKEIAMLYPRDAFMIIYRLMEMLMICMMSVCSARYLIKGNKRILDLFKLIIGLVLLSYDFPINQYIQLTLIVLLILFYYREALQTWRVEERRANHAEN